MTPAKRRCIAQSAMAAKKLRGEEPCITAVVHSCPHATMNPETCKPFCDKKLREIMTTDCYDFTPEFPWRFQGVLQKIFLPEEVKQHRVSTAEILLSQRPDPEWWAHNVVWFDPGGSVIPGSQAQYNKMRQGVKRNQAIFRCIVICGLSHHLVGVCLTRA